ncbi:MAG: 50S ribosomal protein L22 [Rhodospirillales bacterium]|nr:50S ribosomal protein L22 [Rhodospirillales bacterium]
MGKPKAPNMRAKNEAQAMIRNLRVSPQKLNLVCQQIRGMSAERALAVLAFSKRRIADDVRNGLQSAIANAENNHQLDVDRLIVAEAYAGKSFILKRFRARARGRGARILKPWSQLTVVVREAADAA